jgi:hypothetical protein
VLRTDINHMTRRELLIAARALQLRYRYQSLLLTRTVASARVRSSGSNAVPNPGPAGARMCAFSRLGNIVTISGYVTRRYALIDS